MEVEPIRILYVEDDAAQARLLKQMLERDGDCQVTIATRLWDGFELMARHDFDLILVDRGLPDEDEDATAPAMIERAARVPVVVISGHPDADIMERRAMAAGAVGYIDKMPFFTKKDVRTAAVKQLTEWAALGRYRRKQMARIDETMSTIKEQLDTEIAALKNQVAELKRLLVAHEAHA